MTQQAPNTNRTDIRPHSPGDARANVAFKPVALPAVAAAVRASRQRPRPPQHRELPAILRDETASN
jgi:hypothetical protein